MRACMRVCVRVCVCTRWADVSDAVPCQEVNMCNCLCARGA